METITFRVDRDTFVRDVNIIANGMRNISTAVDVISSKRLMENGIISARSGKPRGGFGGGSR